MRLFRIRSGTRGNGSLQSVYVRPRRVVSISHGIGSAIPFSVVVRLRYTTTMGSRGSAGKGKWDAALPPRLDSVPPYGPTEPQFSVVGSFEWSWKLTGHRCLYVEEISANRDRARTLLLTAEVEPKLWRHVVQLNVTRDPDIVSIDSRRRQCEGGSVVESDGARASGFKAE